MLRVQENVSLKNFNTFGIDASAKYFVDKKKMQKVIALSLL